MRFVQTLHYKCELFVNFSSEIREKKKQNKSNTNFINNGGCRWYFDCINGQLIIFIWINCYVIASNVSYSIKQTIPVKCASQNALFLFANIYQNSKLLFLLLLVRKYYNQKIIYDVPCIQWNSKRHGFVDLIKKKIMKCSSLL